VIEDGDMLEALTSATGLERKELDSAWSLLDLGLTSFRIMQALMQIEERFGIEFSDEEIVRFPAAPGNELARLVRERIAASGG